MEYSNAELVEIVNRYKDETGIHLSPFETAGHAFFAGWLLKQNLQQANVMPSLLAFKERRLKLNLSLRDVTKATSVSAATISRIENGKEAEYNNVLMLDKFYASNGA